MMRPFRLRLQQSYSLCKLNSIVVDVFQLLVLELKTSFDELLRRQHQLGLLGQVREAAIDFVS